MAAFSRWSSVCWATLLTVSATLLGGCPEPNLPADEQSEAARGPTRQPQPIDPGDEGQSRNLLQYYIARDFAPTQLAIPSGDELRRESESWRLPFKSKRIVAALLTTVARDRIEDLPSVLSPDATWGEPDPRRIGERPIFDDEGKRFLAELRKAAQRFDEHATYKNPTNFMMGVQEHLRTGAEPMWSYYTTGFDKLLFRFIVRGGVARITYVGFYREGHVPTEPRRLENLGPIPLMTPPMIKEGGEIVHGLPRKAGAPQRGR